MGIAGHRQSLLLASAVATASRGTNLVTEDS